MSQSWRQRGYEQLLLKTIRFVEAIRKEREMVGLPIVDWTSHRCPHCDGLIRVERKGGALLAVRCDCSDAKD